MKKPPLREEEWILIHRMNYESYEIQDIAKKINRPPITARQSFQVRQGKSRFQKH